RHQHTDADCLCHRCEPTQQRPRLEVRSLGPARLDEVVAQPRALVAEAFEKLPALDRLLPGHVLVGADAEAKSPGHSLSPWLNAAAPQRMVDRSCLESSRGALRMGLTTLKMPQLGESVTEGNVVHWLKQE